MNINDLTKTQLVLLVLLVSFVTSFVTGIVTVALVEQAPPPITQTIQKVVERIKEFPVQISEQKLVEPKGEVSGKVTVITQEDQVINIVRESSPAVVSVVGSKGVLGAGFFVSADGLVVTSRDAAEDSEADYSVILSSGRSHAAKILARDPERDLAVLKVDPSTGSGQAGFPYLSLGDSSQVKIGQTVIAIGNGRGQFQNTVSVGVISGLGSSTAASSTDVSSGEFYGIIQTDTAINPGNFGGPLLDLSGRVIGVNTAAAVDAGNIGFALPIDFVKKMIEEIENEVELEEKQAN